MAMGRYPLAPMSTAVASPAPTNASHLLLTVVIEADARFHPTWRRPVREDLDPT
jgi:hypothetical protein